MSAKPELLAAVREELRALIPEVGGRVKVTVQDPDGSELIPMEMEAPFLTVADGGMTTDWLPGMAGDERYEVRVRAYVRDLRDVETPVLGYEASGTTGAAGFQAKISAALRGNKMAGRIAGIDLALPTAELPVSSVEHEAGFQAVIGDVRMRYEMSTSL